MASNVTTAVLPAAFFLAALLITWSYPLTEKRFAAIMEEIRARRIAAAAKEVGVPH